MSRLRKIAVLQAVCLMMTGAAVCMPAVREGEQITAAAYYEETDGNFRFVREEDHRIRITGYTGSADTVTFPAAIAGMPVCFIGDGENPVLRGDSQQNVIGFRVPEQPLEIADCAFSQCTGLETVKLPDTVSYLGRECFSGCVRLQSAELPREMDLIRLQCFDGCTRLRTVAMPEKLDSVALEAFRGCKALEAVRIPADTRIISGAFEGCTRLRSVTLGKGVTLNGAGIFRGCQALDTIWLPNSVTVIPEGTFEGCIRLSAVRFGRKTARIQESAFAECRSLKTVTLPEAFRAMSPSAFLNCSALERVTIKNTGCAFLDAADTTICNEKQDGKAFYQGVICGFDDSSVQMFAEKFGLTFESLGPVPEYYASGDVDNDSRIGLSDAQAVLREYTDVMAGKNSTFTELQSIAADVNLDDETGIDDAQLILMYYTESAVAGRNIRWDDLPL